MFGLDFFGYHFISSIITFKVQFSLDFIGHHFIFDHHVQNSVQLANAAAPQLYMATLNRCTSLTFVHCYILGLKLELSTLAHAAAVVEDIIAAE